MSRRQGEFEELQVSTSQTLALLVGQHLMDSGLLVSISWIRKCCLLVSISWMLGLLIETANDLLW